MPPHSEKAEQGVLGCCLLAPENLNTCEEAGLIAEGFYDLRHQLIYTAMLAMHQASKPVDLITLFERLKEQGWIEEVGGISYLQTLPDVVPSAGNLAEYLEKVRDLHLLRCAIRLCQETVDEAMEFEGEVQPFLSEFEVKAMKLAEGADKSTETNVREVLPAVVDDLEDYRRGHAQIRGLTTGLDYMDKLLCGFGQEQGNYFVISGRPSTGKTSLTMQIAEHLAHSYVWWEPVLDANGQKILIRKGERDVYKAERRVGIPVGVFSLEMTNKALVRRMLFERAGADMQRWRTGFAEGADVPGLHQARSELSKPQHIWLEQDAYSIEKIRSKARRWFRQYGVKCFVLDYLQLMESETKRKDGRVEELRHISKEIKRLCKALNVPWIVIAQMNRDFEKEGQGSRTPRLADLKDCGAIEQDADIVGMLYTPQMGEKEQEVYDRVMKPLYPAKEWSKRPRRVNIIFPKNREGMQGLCQLLFQKSCTKFHDWNQWLQENRERPLPGPEQKEIEE